jgi:voltage-gated potassium channel
MDAITRKQRLYTIIFGTTTRAGRLFDIVLLFLIMGSIIVVVMESITQLPPHYLTVLHYLEWFFTLLFSIEYLLRIYVSHKKLAYIFSYMGIIDLLSIVPTYISLFLPGGQFLTVVRGLRLLRVFRILKMIHYVKQIQIILHSIRRSIPKISIFMLFIAILVVILGTLMYVVEGNSNGFKDIPNSIYWAIVTLSTVGYGDITPVTPLGKIIASVIMLTGYGIIAVPSGILTAEMVLERKATAKKKAKKEKQQQKTTCTACGNKELLGAYCHVCGQKAELTQLP